MSHLALYRKYRSQTFGELIGQDHVVRTLQNALQKGAIHHAFLFTGPRGTGKTSTARLLAKALNCANGPTSEPCGQCVHCTEIAQGSALDVVEMDAASDAGVDDVRERIVDVVQYKPVMARFKVFIIDEVHDLSAKAFDALLKTIEEPPSHIVFILATTELHKVPPTIQSRCQKFSFHRAHLHDLERRLKTVIEGEGRTADEAALTQIARQADGGFRDALSLMEQVLATSEGHLTYDHVLQQLGLIRDEVIDSLITALLNQKHAETLDVVDQVYRGGRDATGLVEALIQRVANLTRIALTAPEQGANTVSDQMVERAKLQEWGLDRLISLRSEAASWLRDLRSVSLPKLWLESKFLAYGYAPLQRRANPAPTPADQPKAQAEKTSSAPAAAVQMAEQAKQPSPKPEPKDEGGQAWVRAVSVVSAKSKAARERLSGSSATLTPDGVLEVVFRREVDREWVSTKPGLMPLLRQELNSVLPSLKDVQLSSGNGVQNQKPIEEPAVELPLEGERLRKKLMDELDGF